MLSRTVLNFMQTPISGGLVKNAGAVAWSEVDTQEAALIARCNTGDEAACDDEHDDDAHDGSRLAASHRIAPVLMPTTVIELTGIRIAAASGVSAPVSASPRPIPL